MLNIILGAIALGMLWGIMTLGVHLTYRILDIADLSVEGTFATGGAIAASMIVGGVNPWLATLAAMAGGLVGGFITGILHTKLKIPALLAGILTMTAAYSINLRIMGRANVPLPATGNKSAETVFTPFSKLFNDMVGDYSKDDSMAWLFDILTNKNFIAIIVALIFVVVVSLITYWFFGTELGSAIRATGNNQKMVRAQGINTTVMIIIGLMLSNGLVSLAGALIAQYQNFSDVTMGTGSIVIGLASLIIGEVIVGTKSFKRTLVSLAVGAVIYRIIIALVMWLGMEANDLKLFTAVTIAICLAPSMIQSILISVLGVFISAIIVNNMKLFDILNGTVTDINWDNMTLNIVKISLILAVIIISWVITIVKIRRKKATSTAGAIQNLAGAVDPLVNAALPAGHDISELKGALGGKSGETTDDDGKEG